VFIRNRQSRPIRSWRRMGTLRVCSYLAGMKGKPFSGFLFNHVPFFLGVVS
jgi:hypothetical protein